MLLASLRAVDPEITPVVIDPSASNEWGPRVQTRLIQDLVGRSDTFIEMLNPEDAVAYALPHLLEELAQREQDSVLLNPNIIVTGRIQHVNALGSGEEVLVGSTMQTEPTSRTPHLDRIQRSRDRAPVRLVAVGHKAIRFRSLLAAAMKEVSVDPFLRNPAQVLDWVTTSAVETGLATSLPPHFVVGLADYGMDTEDGPYFLDAEPLWDALDQQEKREETPGYGGTPIGTLLMEQRVHDLAPLHEPLGFIEAEIALGVRMPQPDRPGLKLILDARRAADPVGDRWGASQADGFRRWLYERNAAGLTRIGHLFWLTRPDLMQTFPEVRWDASRFRRWNNARAVAEFGIDLFDETHEMTAPDGEWIPPPHALGQIERLRNAVAWRYNIVRTLIPGKGREPGSERATAVRLRTPIRHSPNAVATRFGAESELITLMGLLRSNSGLGQAARASFRALEYLNRPFSVLDTTDQYLSKNTTDPGLDRHPFGAFGELNLIHANSAEFAAPLSMFHHRLGGRFNAAMWFWEGATLPEEWLPAFDRVDELWLASNYLADVFGQYERVPVHVIGLAADLPEPGVADRSKFGLRDDELVFLFVFDAQSVAERKNPDLALSAFETAFGRGTKGVRFIVKTHNLHKMPESEARLRRAEASNPNVKVINEYWGRDQLLQLMQAADVYVSPHAAEGFGLTLLESMALGTPVVATAFSGNMDFTTDSNSWLIDYTLTSLEHRAGPYPAGTVWAQPSVEALVEIMRAVSHDRTRIVEKGATARQDALETASLERYAKRLDEHLDRVL